MPTVYTIFWGFSWVCLFGCSKCCVFLFRLALQVIVVPTSLNLCHVDVLLDSLLVLNCPVYMPWCMISVGSHHYLGSCFLLFHLHFSVFMLCYMIPVNWQRHLKLCSLLFFLLFSPLVPCCMIPIHLQHYLWSCCTEWHDSWQISSHSPRLSPAQYNLKVQNRGFKHHSFHVISQSCPWPSIALQCRIVA